MNTDTSRTPAADDRLRKWLNASPNTHAREALFMHRLCFDVQLAAARAGYYVNTYYDDVDHDGFDIIFDDRDTIKKMQVKTVDAHSRTKQWSIRKRMLRPPFELVEKLGFEPSPTGEGSGGGVILMRFDAKTPSVPVEYLYTDVFVLLAFECKILRRSDGKSQAAVSRCLRAMRDGVGSDSVAAPRAVFLRAKGPDELLALAGLHSRPASPWKHQVILVANNTRPYASPQMELPLPLEKLKASAFQELGKLVVDPDLQLTSG